MSLRISLWLACLAIAFPVPTYATIIVDGSTSDWGVSVVDGISQTNKSVLSDFNTATAPLFTTSAVASSTLESMVSNGSRFLADGSLMKFHSEDQSDLAGDGGSLGPYAGGQNYDAEFLGVNLKHGKNLSLLVVTGQRPDNTLRNYSPGDIRITTSKGVFGIEVGGLPDYLVKSNNSFDFATRSSSVPSTSKVNPNSNLAATFALDGSGHTTAMNSNAGRFAGSIWSANNFATDWIKDPINDNVQYPVQLNHSALSLSKHVGDASFVYTKNNFTRQHAVIELSFDASKIFGNDVTINQITWYPGCGNDELLVSFGQRTAPVPEPGSLAVAGCLSLFGLGYQRLRRKRK